MRQQAAAKSQASATPSLDSDIQRRTPRSPRSIRSRSPDGSHGAEAGFAQVDLVAVLERAQQFHAIERTQTQVGFETGIRRASSAEARPVIRAIKSARGLFACSLRQPARQLRLRHFANHISPRLLRRRAGKIFFRPHEPDAHSLIFRQRLIGALHHCLRIGFRVAQNHHRARFGISAAFHPDHHAIFHLGCRRSAASRSSG